MIDNYDSFVYNLVAYFREAGAVIEVVRNDALDMVTIREGIAARTLEGVILSPGPKTPEKAGGCLDVVRHFYRDVPMLGVCLGHQIIGSVWGGRIIRGKTPVHGKVHRIITNGKGIFQGLPQAFRVTRYHSLVIDSATVPTVCTVDAVTEDGVVMAISHKRYPIYGVQFHPEAVLTEYGHEMIQNFMTLSREWWKNGGAC